MNTHSNLNFLLASGEPDLLFALEPLLAECGAHVNIALAAEDALAVIAAPIAQSLVLLDVRLPGMEICRLLAAMRDAAGSRRFPIVLISDTVTEELLDRLAEGVIDDIVPRGTAPEFWRVRIGSVMRGFRAGYDLEQLRESLALNAQFDRLTGVYNRDALLAMLFRETDRVQRMKSSLCMVLFDVDDFGHWNSRLGADACDGLLCQIVDRTSRLLRSYDLLGRVGEDEFLIAMPGCSAVNAVMLAERLRVEVFCEPFHVAGETIRLSACFGISSSHGRSALVVLREAEHALAWARSAGPESILCFGESSQPAHASIKYLSPATSDELLAG